MFHIPGVLTRIDPVTEPVPVVFDVPRSGTWYPCEFRTEVSFDDLHRSVSMHLPDLYQGVPQYGAQLLVAHFPNAFIDANRNETDIDPSLLADDWKGALPLNPTVKSELGIGLIHSVAGQTGTPLYDYKLTSAEIQSRIDQYFLPYHDELARIIQEGNDRHKVSYHISCHSMASIGGSSTLDKGQPRTDFDIGDLNGQSCEPEFAELVVKTLKSFGFNVTSNFHYAGAEAVRRHSRVSERKHSLQIEINRKLYMNEQDFSKSADFADIQKVLAKLADEIRLYALAQSSS